ncbi:MULTISPECIES: carboxylesterase family protein [unclassified Pseudonocardia]|uniref:carboxylesterase/lipase family protein n=1 Tax=unclassified Pseudonocardia TaxID=2619320 RepID=UPI00094AEE5D|nr:putative carboxylesterase [Pseudonocardia sp. Ae707_Ps1]
MTSPDSAPVVRTTSGRVRGTRTGGVVRFRSVPYAAPPTGPLRYAAPAPVPGWDGVRDAGGGPGPNAPQPVRAIAGGLDMSPVIGTGWRPGADFLTADVWTPDPAAGGLPVLVFVHGGAFVAGEASAPAYDGTALAADGVVLVSVNYRLGAEGFLPLDGGATNVGLRDQLAALAWVRDNVAAFGGDPGRVTVFGESAGAMSIGLLLASPQSAGLFRRAVVQSGGAEMARSGPERAAPFAAALAAGLGAPASAEAFRGFPVEDVAAAQGRVDVPGGRGDLREADGRDPGFGITGFLPVLGDDVLPEDPLTALRAGAGADVDLVAGSNADEMNLYLVPTGALDALTEDQARTVVAAVAPGATLSGDGSPGERYSRLMTELVFAGPTRRLLDAHTGRRFGYLFGYRSTACGGRLGAAHATELPFVFGTLDRASGPSGLAGDAPPAALSDRMRASWVRFAADGDPGWPAWDPAAPVRRRFDVEDTDEEATDDPAR